MYWPQFGKSEFTLFANSGNCFTVGNAKNIQTSMSSLYTGQDSDTLQVGFPNVSEFMPVGIPNLSNFGIKSKSRQAGTPTTKKQNIKVSPVTCLKIGIF